MSDIQEVPSRRAGFWRRLITFLVDMAVVLIPIQIIVAVLFSLTNGMVQTGSGFLSNNCVDLQQLPAGLSTQIENPNFAQDCRKGFFGFDTMRVLVVGRTDQTDVGTKTIYESFWLDADGQLTDRLGTRLDWVSMLALTLYLIGMEWRFGRSLGRRLVRSRVVEKAHPDMTGVPIGRAIARQFAKLIGLVPMLLAAAWTTGFSMDVARLEQALSAPSFMYVPFGAGALSIVWFIWIIVSMVRKRDPIYDRLAGTAVLRA